MKEMSSINVLLVDDRPENLVAMEALLDSSPIHPIKCLSGEEALKFLMKEEVALILLDVQMPGLNGYETARIIKSREKSKDIPIIFVTALNKDPEHVYSGYSAGGVDYLFKPYDPDVLKSKVDSFVNLFLNTKKLVVQTGQLQEQTSQLELANQELSRLTAELRKAEALARVIGETSMDTMIVCQADGTVLSVNPAVEKMFGHRADEVQGKVIEMLFQSGSLPIYGQFKAVPQGRTTALELTACAKDGRYFPAEVQINETVLEGQRIFAFTIRDISERKGQMAALEHMALHDVLTSLPNRSLLYDKIGRLISKGNAPFTLILLDLDHFKEINDTFGHHYGDMLLTQIGPLIEPVLGAEDTFVRMGGDEFAVLLPDSDVERAIQTANLIMGQLYKPFVIESMNLTVGASAGIVMYPEHGRDADSLIRHADVAMYAAKRNRSDYCLYTMKLDNNDPYRLMLMGDLRDAIENGQLILYYQPKVNMQSGEVYGVEALVRWKHPEFGFIQPGDFIPLAEQLGLVKPLTFWVLQEALRQCKQWEEQGLDIRVAVNLSVRSLQDVQLPEQVSECLSRQRVSAGKLTLEITESFIMADPIRAKQILLRLHEMGIGLSIDDFGTGYSSLSYLNRLPVDTIKIDKSFVADMLNEVNDMTIVRSIINLAHTLGLKVVAEGVETAGVWQLLVDFGCDEVQGFYLSEPLPAAELTDWLEHYRHNRTG